MKMKRFPFGSKKGIPNDGMQSEDLGRRFSIDEIKSAINNLDPSLLIGRGGFGTVYKGRLANGATVAIKRLTRLSGMEEEFWAEVKTLSRLHHIHLLTLIGYCKHRKDMFLVYEYMPNGNLADNLYKLKCPLTWEQRLGIITGAARGLAYLHAGTRQHVVHRDVKPSNILLDQDLIPKISDFGLSRVATQDSCITTNVAGTAGYLDPDYIMTGKVTYKSDVYSFGVVMLEVLCGRSVHDSQFREEGGNLTTWALQCIKDGKVEFIIDPFLKDQVSSDCLKCFAQVAVKCLHLDPKERPTMDQVVWSLELALMSQHQGTVHKVLEGISVITNQEIDHCLLLQSWKGKGSESGSSRDRRQLSVSDSVIQPQTCSDFMVNNETRGTTYYFDGRLTIGQGASSKVHRVCIDGSASKVSRKHGKKNPSSKRSEQQFTTLQVQGDKKELGRHQGEGLEIQVNEDNPLINSMTQLATSRRNGHSSNLDMATSHKRLGNSETEIISKTGDSQVLVDLGANVVSDEAKSSVVRAKVINHSDPNIYDDETLISSEQDPSKIKRKRTTEDLKVSPIMGTTIQEKRTEINTAVLEEKESKVAYSMIMQEEPQTLEFKIEATQSKKLYPARKPQERLEDDEQGSGPSTLTSSSSTSLALEGNGKGIRVLKSTNGMITLRDQFGAEVRLGLTRVRENIRPQLLRIIELRPHTFMQIGKLSSSFVKLIMEHFGGLLELLECTVLKEASSNAFDEMLQMLEDLKRNMLNVEWLEDKLRVMFAQVKFELVNSDLGLTTMKIVECEIILAELKEKKKKLEIEARHLEKQPRFEFDMDGNASQVLL